MEFVAGPRAVGPGAARHSTAPSARAIYDEMNRVIAALHTVDPARVGLADYGKPGNYFERQIGRWTKQYLASITEPIEAMDRLIEWLPAHIPPSARDETQSRSCTATTASTTCLPPHRAARARGARLGAVDARPSARRLQLPLHVLAHPAGGTVPRHRRPRPSPRSASRPSASTCAATASAPADGAIPTR